MGSETECGDVVWFQLSQDIAQWWTSVNSEINFQVPQKTANFSTAE
jgi:hypothetical protein